MAKLNNIIIPDNKGNLLQLLDDAYLGLGDTTQLILTNPLLPSNQFDIENPHLQLLRLMRNPDYFWFTCKWLFNIDLLPFQVNVLKELWLRKFPMMICSRGFGKSFLLAVYSVLRALFNQGSKVVVVGAAFRQSKLVFEYMENMYRNSPILYNIIGSGDKQGPKRDVDRCSFYIGRSVIHAIPLGQGDKIRGLRSTHTISDEFSSIPEEIFETVVGGFSAVNLDPVSNVKRRAQIDLLKTMNAWTEQMEDAETSDNFGNQTVISGTAYYAFNHFYKYWEKWHKIISSKGNQEKLTDLFNGEIPNNFNWKHYSIIRVPYSKLPPGFMDESTVARAKATIHSSIYQMEYEAVFAKDSDGFFKRSLIESCICSRLEDSPFIFNAVIKGNPNSEYIFGVDTASERDNFAIVIIEKCGTQNRIVYCWTMNRKRHRDRIKKNIIKEHDFYDYCARKIRDLMKVFPTSHIAIDAQGGGRAVMEALQDPARLQAGEQRLLPYTKGNDNFWWEKEGKPTDMENGLHIIHQVEFANAQFTSEANHGLKKDFETKTTLFPHFDPYSIAEAIKEDKARGFASNDDDYRLYDTLEDCVMDIEELKDELATIQMTQTSASGRDRWDTPETVEANGKKGRLRKDRYSALLLANMIARVLTYYTEKFEYNINGTYVGKEHKGATNSTFFYGNAQLASKANNLLYGTGITRKK